jgi:hypothetical protein
MTSFAINISHCQSTLIYNTNQKFTYIYCDAKYIIRPWFDHKKKSDLMKFCVLDELTQIWPKSSFVRNDHLIENWPKIDRKIFYGKSIHVFHAKKNSNWFGFNIFPDAARRCGWKLSLKWPCQSNNFVSQVSICQMYFSVKWFSVKWSFQSNDFQ